MFGKGTGSSLQRSRQCDGKEGAVRKGYEHCVKKIEKGTGSGAGVTGRKRQCVKLMSIVGKRNMALMRNNEMHEMEVDCSM